MSTMQSNGEIGRKSFIVTIDGPAGSGKSSLAASVAKALRAQHLNSGLLYRAVAKRLCSQELLLHQGEMPSVHEFLAKRGIKDLDDIQLRPGNSAFEVVVAGQNWTHLLHTKELDRASAWLATSIIIRDYVLKIQRSAASFGTLVIDGRDCGTEVFPQADLKLFLTASSRARALRIMGRARLDKLDPEQLAKVEAQINSRDFQDQTREVSPLKPADDALIIDNSELSLSGTVEKVLQLLRSRKLYE